MPWHDSLDSDMEYMMGMHKSGRNDAVTPGASAKFFEDDVMNVHVAKADPAVRKNAGKTRYDLIDWAFVEQTADVLGFGAEKYAPNAWRNGMAVTGCLASLFRHLIAFSMGQDKDPESGLSHLGHAGCNLMFIAAYLRDKPELDDRQGRA